MDILGEIAERAKARVEKRKKILPADKLAEMARSAAAEADFPFEKALRTDDIAFICEVKKASPSKGVIADDYPYLEIAKDYEAAGAAAISVLTEPYYFKGADGHLRDIAAAVGVPLLRKDFVVDDYMIYEAKVLGANAVLLICALLSDEALADYIGAAHSLGLSALAEARDEAELGAALRAGARVVGVNNRDLKTFDVDAGVCIRLRKHVPDGVIFVAESGIKTAGDVETLRRHGVDAVLIGEALMRAPDKSAALAGLRGRRV